MSCALICMWITSVGTPALRMDAGCRRFQMRNTCSADRERAFWTERHKDQPEACPWISDSVLPIVEAKRFELVKSSHSLSDLVHLVPTPGHTIDHYSVRVGKVGADALITGDMVHSPLQMRYPELGMMSDFNSDQAGQTRRVVFTQLSETPTVVCTGHFPSPF